MSTATKTCVAIQHVAFENLDGFEEPLRRAGYRIDYVHAADGFGSIGDAADLLVVLGGPIGAFEEHAYPFLSEELAIIEARLARREPLMGICLGAQLIARACGARVFPSGHKEIGYAPVTLTDAGRRSCLAPFADGRPVLHWHGDTFDLPPGAERLASTGLCENQAYRIGAAVIGFQFHPEATGGKIEHWLVGHACELAAAGLDVNAIRRQAEAERDRLERHARQVAVSWLGQLDDE